MEITFTADNCKIDIERIKELTQNTNCKVVDLSPEKGWEKMEEHINYKYFINKNKSSKEYGQVIRKLTDEEFNAIECGFRIDAVISVVGTGFATYINRYTKEKFKSHFYFS